MSDKSYDAFEKIREIYGSNFTSKDMIEYFDNFPTKSGDNLYPKSKLKKRRVSKKAYKKQQKIKGVEVLIDPTGESMDRYQFINQYLHGMLEENISLTDDDLSILHGEKGLIIYLMNETLDAVDKFLKNHQNELYKNLVETNIVLLNLYFLKKLTLFNLFTTIVNTEGSDVQDMVQGFLSDKRYEFNLTEKAYLIHYLRSSYLEIRSVHNIEDADISSLRWTFDVMKILKYKNLKEDERIIKCTIHVGKDDRLIDVTIETRPGCYSNQELLKESWFFQDEFITYDNRYSEEQILKKKYPYLDSKSISYIAFSNFQQGKTRGAQELSVYDDSQWKLSYIQPLLNSFELEVSLINEDLLKTYQLNKDILKKANPKLFNLFLTLAKHPTLYHKINLLTKLIEINVYHKMNNELDTNKHYRNKLVEFAENLHRLRNIRNLVAHSEPIDEDDIEFVLDEIDKAVRVLHAFKSARETGYDKIDSETNLPEWFTGNAQLMYESVMTFSLEEFKAMNATQNDTFD